MTFWSKRWRQILFVTVGIGLLTIFLTEVIGRQMGLCDPVLSVADPDMEYRFAPNQECYIRDNRVIINSVSMRSDEVDPNRSHILLLGDSVIWGGTLVDQSELASTKVEKALGSDRVQVLNASAGSWGPPNLLAYVRKFGTFGAQTAVIVVSSQDADDAMTFEPLVGVNSSFPDKKPVSVTLELIQRYIPRLWEIIFSGSSASSDSTSAHPVNESVMKSLAELVSELRHQGIRIVVVMHPLRDELETPNLSDTWAVMEKTVRNAGGEWFDARPVYRAYVRQGQQLYRDVIHLTVAGQQALGEAILQALQARS